MPQARALHLAEEFGEEIRDLYSWDQDLWVERSDGRWVRVEPGFLNGPEQG